MTDSNNNKCLLAGAAAFIEGTVAAYASNAKLVASVPQDATSGRGGEYCLKVGPLRWFACYLVVSFFFYFYSHGPGNLLPGSIL